jgi:hypothetical protein
MQNDLNRLIGIDPDIWKIGDFRCPLIDDLPLHRAKTPCV